MMKRGEKAFTITAGTGFQMVIGQRILSVQFGCGNYCENQATGLSPVALSVEREGVLCVSSDNAEVAVMDLESGEFLYGYTGGTDVQGWVSSEEVAELIALLSIEALEARQREEEVA